MEYEFASKSVELLYTSGKGAAKYPSEVVDALLRRVRHIEVAKDEQDLHHAVSLHVRPVGVNGADGLSVYLALAWRLILSIVDDTGAKYVVIREVINDGD